MMPTNAGLNNKSQTGYSSYTKGILKLPETNDETREEIIKQMNESNEIPVVELKHIERKQCPFCKCKHTMTWHIGHYNKPWVVECMECSAQGPHAETEEEAIELWNKGAIE